MLRGEVAEETREHDTSGPGRRADLERPVELALGALGELVDEVLFEREQPLGAAVEARAGLGRLDASARAVEELHPEALLERAHLQRDRRLRHPEPLGGLRERAALDHGAERAQLSRLQVRATFLDVGYAAQKRRRIAMNAAASPAPPAVRPFRRSTATRSPSADT